MRIGYLTAAHVKQQYRQIGQQLLRVQLRAVGSSAL
jgi:hypothetical protein